MVFSALRGRIVLLARIALCLAVLLPPVCRADGQAAAVESRWGQFQQTLERAWHAERYELYVPLNIWHNPRAYSAQKIDAFNTQPWGVGIGKTRYDADGDWHGLYAMAFLDSHGDPEPIVGYGFQKLWRPAAALRLGAGFTLGITARSDYSYLPLPIVLPLASIEYGRLALQATYIPGGKGNGNVLFTWLRWQL